MEEKDSIKDLFQEQLSQLETPVRPEIWASISSSIAGSTAATVSTGMSLLAKITIGITLAASVTGTVFYLTKEEAKPTTIKNEETQKVQFQTEKTDKTQTQKSEDKTVENQSTPQNNRNSLLETANLSTSNSTKVTEKQTIINPISITEIAPIKKATSEEVKTPKLVEEEHVSTQKKEATPIIEKLPEQSKLQFNLPNIFTPNGDGNNDYLKIEIENVSEFVIVVLDTKSNVVFKSEDPDFKWEGTDLQGDKLPAGNYLYYVTAKDQAGKPVTKYSALTIKY